MVGYTGWAGDLEHCWTHNAPFCGGKFLVISLSVVTAWAEFTAGAALLYTGVRHIAAS